MKIMKKIKICLLALTLMFFSNKSFAMSQEEAGQIIAQFAINFYDNYASETIYSLTGWDNNVSGQRAYAYRGQKVSGIATPCGSKLKPVSFQNKYAMDCVGFVSFCIHHSLGMGNANTFTCFVTPQSGGRNGFAQVNDGSRKPGDILATSGHVVVYIGNGEVIESAGIGPNRSINRAKTAHKYPKTFRITQSAAAGIYSDNTTVQFEGKGTTSYSFDEENAATTLIQILSGTVPEHWIENCKDYTGNFNWTNVSYVSVGTSSEDTNDSSE